MSGKLDQSLDEILSTQRRGGAGARGRGRAGRRAPQTGRTTAVVAPVGGVKKSVRLARGAAKSVPTGPSGANGDSKIVVSNLPRDVNEVQIKEYFGKSVGPIKRVEISYGPNGASRGIANIIFSRADGASKALTQLNGLLVDGKPMKIEMVVDASRASTLPAPKGLGDRIQAPKSQPKSAANTKATASAAKGEGARRGKGRPSKQGGKSARPAKKTAEELDSEMMDYFGSGEPAAEASTAAPVQAAATNGDAMEDEVL